MVSSTSCCQRSSFPTGFLARLRQRFARQRITQPFVNALQTVVQSVWSVTSLGRSSARRPWMAPVSSILSLVVSGSAPQISRRRPSSPMMTAAQPPIPGLGAHDPSE